MMETGCANSVSSVESPCTRDGLTVHELDGEGLVFDPATGNTHRLNQTALFIWRLCDGQMDEREIADRLSKLYDVSLEDSQQHTDRMIDEFRKARLLEESNESLLMQG